MGCFDGLFKPKGAKSAKRKSKTYQKRVRARERELRRQRNGEDREWNLTGTWAGAPPGGGGS